MDSATLICFAAAPDQESTESHKLESSRCRTWPRELYRIFCMQGGDEDGSYARNSESQASAIALVKPLLLEAIGSMKLFAGDTSIKIADLGCATGNNTLSTIETAVTNLRRRYEEERRGFVPEFEAFFSDLPSNDFNSLFRSLVSTFSDAGGRSPYFAAGVPGSFYKRLFPRGKLHLALSLSALHWLSQIPEAVLDKQSPAWNEGRVWIDGANTAVVDAYAEQSAEDLRAFLHCRREEIVEGGMLFVLMAGRPDSHPPEKQFNDPESRFKHAFTIMDRAWEDLLAEGLIDEDTRDTFNIPAYMRSTREVKRAFDDCQGFEIRRLEYLRLLEHANEWQEEWTRDPASYGRAQVNMIRADLNPIVEAHLGPELSDELFKRYEKRVSEAIHKNCFFGLIVVCAMRK